MKSNVQPQFGIFINNLVTQEPQFAKLFKPHKNQEKSPKKLAFKKQPLTEIHNMKTEKEGISHSPRKGVIQSDNTATDQQVLVKIEIEAVEDVSTYFSHLMI